MFNTKINLSDNKSQQLSGQTLSLSGITHIYSQLIINSGATLSILPNHGDGKVLTSDVNGLGTWKTPTMLSEYIITGNSTNTGFTVTHNKNKTFVGIEVIKNTSPYPTIYTSVSRPTTNTVCITFDTAPLTGQQYKILITS